MGTKRLAVFDLDGTLFRWQLYYEVVLKLVEQDFFSLEQAESIRTNFHAWQSRKLAFREFERVAIAALDSGLTKLAIAQFKTIIQTVLDESSHKVYSYTRNLAEELKRDGYYLLAISGSMQEIAEPFSKLYGFDDCIGWLYEQKNGRFTGKTSRITVGKKDVHIRDYIAKHGFSLDHSVMVGDSGGDISMLELAARPIAFNPSEELLDEALKHGWEIVVERKNIAYSLTKDSDGHIVLAKADRF